MSATRFTLEVKDSNSILNVAASGGMTYTHVHLYCNLNTTVGELKTELVNYIRSNPHFVAPGFCGSECVLTKIPVNNVSTTAVGHLQDNEKILAKLGEQPVIFADVTINSCDLVRLLDLCVIC